MFVGCCCIVVFMSVASCRLVLVILWQAVLSLFVVVVCVGLVLFVCWCAVFIC